MSDTVEITIELDQQSCQIKPSLVLAERTGLSQAKIKDAMQKGAVWLCRGKTKKRLRRAGKSLKVGDKLEFNYNPDILEQEVPEPQLYHDAGEYSIWFKPYGLNCQGSRWGDFASINRWVEFYFAKAGDEHARPVFLVHRLDRATSGLMILCHSKNAARLFSEMFKEGMVDKRYQAIVQGDFSSIPVAHEVRKELDGKAARSQFTFAQVKGDFSLVDVTLFTGRKHQIRQHLSSLGYPIVGDRLYGEGSNERDLQLQSLSLRFDCPFSNQEQFFEVLEKDRLSL